MPDIDSDIPLAETIQSYAAERRLKEATLHRWLELSAADGAALLDLAVELRLGENQLRDLWIWSEEISQRDGLPMAVVLADLASSAHRRDLGRNDKLEKVRSELRRRRFPELSGTEERLVALVQAQGLPRGVRFAWPPFLEGDEVRVEIVATSALQLREAAEALAALTATPVCAEMFALLRGES